MPHRARPGAVPRPRRARTLTLLTDTGERVTLTGRPAEVLALLALELTRRTYLASATSWSVEVRVSAVRLTLGFAEVTEACALAPLEEAG